MNDYRSYIADIVVEIDKREVDFENYSEKYKWDLINVKEMKKMLNFVQSFKYINKVVLSEEIFHLGFLEEIFKVFASSGYLKQAKDLLNKGIEEVKESKPELLEIYENHLSEMDEAIKDKETLNEYLKKLSEFSYYDIDRVRDYKLIRIEYGL